MKKTVKVITTILALTLLVTSCKKKETSTTTPTNNTNTTPVKGGLYAKVNGSDWYVGKSGPAELTYEAIFGNSIGFGGYSQLDQPNTSLGVSLTYTTGLVSFSKYGVFTAFYQTSNGTHYPAISGTMNITQIDTVSEPSKFKATFSFITDTISGKSYTITEGAFNL